VPVARGRPALHVAHLDGVQTGDGWSYTHPPPPPPIQEMATILLVETLRVGAAVLLIAGVALVASAILTETSTDKPRHGEDPFAGFGFIGAVGLGIGAICTSIPMWTTFRAIRIWQHAIPPRDLQYSRPIRTTEGAQASIVPAIAHSGQPRAQYSIIAGRLPCGLQIDKRTGRIAGVPSLREGDSAPGAAEAYFRVTVQASNLKGNCRDTITMSVQAQGAGSLPASSDGVRHMVHGQGAPGQMAPHSRQDARRSAEGGVLGGSHGALVFSLGQESADTAMQAEARQDEAPEMMGGVWEYRVEARGEAGQDQTAAESAPEGEENREDSARTSHVLCTTAVDV
jgi:hypothetical protein